MKRDDAKKLILAAIRPKFPTVPFTEPSGGIVQYGELLRERPELFDFRDVGDKWQTVQGWLKRAGIVAS